MKFNITCLIIAFLMTVTIGCSTNTDIQKTAVSKEEEFHIARKIAWEFLKERQWNDRAKDNWKNAKVTETTVDENYELLNKGYKGRTVLSVSFEDKEAVATSTPIILVDPAANEIVGYLPGE
ncbi:hypothetical protein RFW18_17085 [Metabacillus idriensis]|uniref:hypothetical protein n=1 Tax=Metabacillus idriensis TaxID=324768 RepID=UPI0028140934|nr:hypothetical protein [Metabacillus idriensis]MDR0139472.1 hypothetical protein [Metabacillus idriensis]